MSFMVYPYKTSLTQSSQILVFNMSLCVIILTFQFILSRRHRSATVDFITIVVGPLRAYLKVFTLFEESMMISESIYMVFF